MRTLSTKAILLFLGLFFNFCRSSSAEDGIASEAGDDETSIENASQYLMKFGYVDDSEENKTGKKVTKQEWSDKIKQSIKDYQCTWGLKQTGKLDDATKNLMKNRRCGMNDEIVKCKNGIKQTARNMNLRSWPNNEVSYRIGANDYTSDMPKDAIDKDFALSMKMWSDVTQLKVENLKVGTPDMRVGFFKGNHGDGSSFDGRGGVLAHAYYPGNYALSGDIHFDDAETYRAIDGDSYDTNFKWVATHEAGHALGLPHTDVYGAVMYPYYSSGVKDFVLHYDDIQRIQKLYGSSDEVVTETPTKEVTMLTPELPTSESYGTNSYETTTEDYEWFDCSNPSVDAILRTAKGLYIFKGPYYYELINNSARRYIIADNWEGVTGKIDAAFYWKAGGSLIYLIMGDTVNIYQSSNNKLLESKKLNKWINGLPSKIDSIFKYGYRSLIVTAGNKFYKIRTKNSKFMMIRGYPKSLSVWWRRSKLANPPARIDASFYSWGDRRVYFFAGDNVYHSKNGRFQSAYRIKDLFDCSATGEKNGRAKTNNEDHMVLIDEGGLSLYDAIPEEIEEYMDIFETKDFELNYDENSSSPMTGCLTVFFTVMALFL